MFSTFSTKNRFIFISLLTITGCSNTFNQVNSMIKESIIGLPSDNIPASQIDQSSFSSIYARIDDAHQVYVLLALAENPQTIPATHRAKQTTELKWISSDAGMLVTRNGRLLKSVNLFYGNLINISSDQLDPIALGLHLTTTPMHWQSTIDWQPGYHISYQRQSTFTFVADETLVINETPIPLKRFDEHVFIPRLGLEYSNQFWIDATSGTVFKSHQKMAPNLPYIDITLLKPYSFKDIK